MTGIRVSNGGPFLSSGGNIVSSTGGATIPVLGVNPVVTSISDQSVTLSWVESGSPAVNRSVLYSLANANTFTIIPVGSSVTSSGAQIVGLNGLTAYDFSISVSDGVLAPIITTVKNITTLQTGAYTPMSDIVFSQSQPIHPAMGFYNIIGRVVVTGGIGPFQYNITSNNPGYYCGQNTGIVSLGGDPVGLSVDVLSFAVTDGAGFVFTKSITISKYANSNPIIFLQHPNFDNGNTIDPFNYQYYIVTAFGGDFGTNDGRGNFYDVAVMTESSGLFQLTGSTIQPKNSTVIPPGNYTFNVTITSPSNAVVTGLFTINIQSAGIVSTIRFIPGNLISIPANNTNLINIFPVVTTGNGNTGTIQYQPLSTISTSTLKGTVIGNACATTPNNNATWSLGGTDAAFFHIHLYTGIVVVNAPLTVGTKNITLTVTDGLVSATRNFAIPVVQGNVISPSNMTMTVSNNLNNYNRGQVVGNVNVTGISGTKKWSVTNPDNYYSAYSGVDMSLFQIDTTGQITCPGMLPARLHTFTVNCSDGIGTCSQTFTTTSVWYPGPTLYVGQGMVATHGAGIGFEHIVDIMPLFMADPGINAGATIIISHNSDLDYYADDLGNGGHGETYRYDLRFGWHGPVKFISADPNGLRPRMGGFINAPVGGCDTGAKGFFNIADGDMIISGIELSWVNGDISVGDNSHGVTGIRKNGDVYGDLTVTNCYIHDCNNNIEAGAGPLNVYVDNCELGNGGTAYVSSGATHNVYTSANSAFIFTNNLSMRTTNGHCVKTRSKTGIIHNNRLYDTERGSASAIIDIPNGGVYEIYNNDIQKGPNAQNGSALQVCAEGANDRLNSFHIYNNRFSVLCPAGNRWGSGRAIRHYGYISDVDGSQSVVNATGNSFYLAQDSALFDNQLRDFLPTTSESDAVTLSLPFALDFTSPGTSTTANTRLGFLNYVVDNAQTFDNFNLVQIDPGVDDIRILASSSIGTTIANCTAYGANSYRLISPATYNPFANGATWSIVQDGNYFPSNPWAPAGMFVINSSTGVVTTGTNITTGVYFIKVRATSISPANILCDYRFYIVVY